MSFVVAIDGPAGTGKGTIAKLLSERLDLINIDTGAMYRCVALDMISKEIKLDEINKIENLLKNIHIELRKQDKKEFVFLNGKDVTDKIRSIEVTRLASPISAIEIVRAKMVELQRKMGEGKNIVMEGRDIGTVVFPNADVKIYLDADVEIRAKRRTLQNKEKNINMTYEEVLEDIKKRDKRDKTRKISPLKVAEDAIVIDGTNMSIEETYDKIKEIILEKNYKLK